jgi:WhiB family redox-sensing transcriptional regulator
VNSPYVSPRDTHAEQPPAWWTFANCSGVDTEIFYPDTRNDAKGWLEFCDPCIVQTDCLQDALTRKEPHGIWGGLTPEERKELATLGTPNV